MHQSINKLGKNQRLYLRKDITTLFETGKAFMAYPLRCTYEITPGEGELQAMFVVPKRLHRRAVVRNLLRRRIKEAYRLSKNDLQIQLAQQGLTLHLSISYVAHEKLDYEQINGGIQKILAKIEHLSSSYSR